MSEKLMVGGQAVIEGVMMRGPKKENIKMLTIITINKNDVPQRGCNRENFCTFSGINSTPAS